MKTTLIAAVSSLLLLAGCTTTQPYQPLPPVKVITETVEVEIYQPPLPPEITLNDVEWKIITNSPCKPATGEDSAPGNRKYYTTERFAYEDYIKEDGTTARRVQRDAEGNRIELEPITDQHGEVIQVCGNLHRKIAEIEAMMDGSFVVLALTPKGYEKMAANLQEVKRYINQQKEIIYYYREATKPKGKQGWIEENQERQQNQLDAAQADNEQTEQPVPEKETTLFGIKLPSILD